MPHVHVRLAQKAADLIGALPAVGGDVTVGTGFAAFPHQGATADVAVMRDRSIRWNANAAPPDTILERAIQLQVTLAAQVPLQMTSEAFGEVVAGVENAVAGADLTDMADDWFLADTQYRYAQDGESQTTGCLLTFLVTTRTPATDAGRTL